MKISLHDITIAPMHGLIRFALIKSDVVGKSDIMENLYAEKARHNMSITTNHIKYGNENWNSKSPREGDLHRRLYTAVLAELAEYNYKETVTENFKEFFDRKKIK